jgi:hypothetical protein
MKTINKINRALGAVALLTFGLGWQSQQGTAQQQDQQEGGEVLSALAEKS